jgi:hypothetical protein
MSLSSSVRLNVAANTTSALDLGTVSYPAALTASVALTSGTGAGQADKVFADTRTLAASGTEDLDLAGVLTDIFGTAITFARVKALVIKAAAGNTNLVQVTRPASNGFPVFMAAGDGVALRPGETLALFAGVADATGHVVTAATGDLLTITNSAGTTGVTYDIMIIGCSA